MVCLHTGTMGVHPACIFIDRAGKVATPERNSAGKHSSYLAYLSPLLRTNWRAPGIFSAVNASVGPPHFFVISSNLTTINIRTIGSVLTLHRHFHLSPLDPLARKREGSAEGATCSVAQSKRGWFISPKWFLAGATLRAWGRASVICLPESVGQGSLVTEHLREVSSLSL